MVASPVVWPGGAILAAVMPAPLRSAAPALLAAVLVVGVALGGARALRRSPPLEPARTGVAAGALPPTVHVNVPEATAAPPKPRCPPEPLFGPRELIIPPPVELAKRVRESPESLGSATIGTPTRGALWGGVQLMPGEGIETAGNHPWGTDVVVRSIERAVREVRRCFADTPKLYVGDISRQTGGWLRPHKSHQSGLDADVGYYYTNGSAWFQQATADNLDVARTWSLMVALVEGGHVEVMFVDRSLQRLLRAHAETIGETRVSLDEVFQSDDRRDTLVRHASGHTSHFHVRFRDPTSAALGVSMVPLLRGRVPLPLQARPASKNPVTLGHRGGRPLLSNRPAGTAKKPPSSKPPATSPGSRR